MDTEEREGLKHETVIIIYKELFIIRNGSA